MDTTILKPLIDYFKKNKNYTSVFVEHQFITQQVRFLIQQLNLDLREIFYRVKHNIPLTKVFTCAYCNKPVKYKHGKGYSKYCSYSCSSLGQNKGTQLQENVQIKYGVSNISKLEIIKRKKKETCLRHFNVDNYTKTQEYKDKYKNIPWLNNKKQKEYVTKHKNNTFNKSSFEQKTYQLLLTKFGKEDIIRQYRSKEYPFSCDFYIKSKDLYIECNGHWTHGWYNHKCLNSFNKSNPEHIKILELYKSKNTKFYKNAIYVWTDLDVRKLECLKKNNLNYKIFWTIEEVKVWLAGDKNV